ncbi:CPK34, partial [Symbiodinium pilosum]
WDEYAWRTSKLSKTNRSSESYLFIWPGKTHEILHASLMKADEETITSEMVVLDSVWVRKWKCRPDGHRRMNFASEVASTTSGTPSQPIRLEAESANLGLPTAVNDDRDAESWDASGALLKGLGFEKVIIIAPANMWRRLAKFDASFKINFDR